MTNSARLVNKLRSVCNILRAFSYEAIVARDKASLDIFWLRDESLEDFPTLNNRGNYQEALRIL